MDFYFSLPLLKEIVFSFVSTKTRGLSALVTEGRALTVGTGKSLNLGSNKAKRQNVTDSQQCRSVNEFLDSRT